MDDEQSMLQMASSSKTTEGKGKRQRMSSDENVDRYWDRFLVLSGNDERFNKLSAIALFKAVNQLIGEPEDARRMADGSILVKTGNRNQSQSLLSLAHVHDAAVKVQPHRTLNTCKGTIVSRESLSCTDIELREWFEERHVVDVKRIPLKQQPLELLILTFRGNFLPHKVSVGFEKCRVRTYIPNPRRCFKCQKYGHVTRTCRGQQKCARCGDENHEHTSDSPCTKEPHCVNCGREHPSYDRSCPVWIREKEVQKLKVEKDVSFPQARRLVEQSAGPVTYKSVLTSSPKPRNSPRRRVSLDSNFTYSKYDNSQDRDPTQLPPIVATDKFEILKEWISRSASATEQKKRHASDDESSSSSFMEESSSQTVEVKEGKSSTVSQKGTLVTSQGNPSRSLPKPTNNSTPRNIPPKPGEGGSGRLKQLNRSNFRK